MGRIMCVTGGVSRDEGVPVTSKEELMRSKSLGAPTQPSLLMPIIQYVLPSRNKQIKKMLHFYWECVEALGGADGGPGG